MADPALQHSIELNSASIEWDLSAGDLSFFGLPSALFWLNPSLLRMLQPLAEEVSVPLFRLLVSYQASLGTHEDYYAMITTLADNFEEGFLAWGRAVSTAGWGLFELPLFDQAQKRAQVIVRNPWELQMQLGAQTHWGCPFLQGKITGIFSHALGVNCWAAEKDIRWQADDCSVTFDIYESDQTIESQLLRLRQERKQQQQAQLTAEVERVTQELQREQQARAQMQEETLRLQDALLVELSTPLIPLNDHILMMPLIGRVDPQRAQRVIEVLLEGISKHQANIAILDITGLPLVDTDVANTLIQAARAVRLLGAEVILTGIQPEVAQTLAGLGIDIQTIVACRSLQDGITYGLSKNAR